MDARLDAMTRAKVDELATRFHQPRASVLHHIMQWGLIHGHAGPLDQGASQGSVRHLSLGVDSELYQCVQQAATAAGVQIAPWLRHMVRRVTIADFPTSWHEATPRERSHDSRMYIKRFMLRLDGPTQQKLADLSSHFDTSMATVVRELVAQARIENFPPNWQMRAAERRC
jgi:hypothetical protein